MPRIPFGLVLAGLVLTSSVPGQDDSFIRSVSSGKTMRLETASVTYQDLETEVEVTIIGTLDMADAAYYESLQKRLKDYDLVLHEGMDDVEDAASLLTLIARVQDVARQSFGLLDRREALKLEGVKAVRADLKLDELRSRLKAEGLASPVDGAEILDGLGPWVKKALAYVSPEPGKEPGRLARMIRLKAARAVATTLAQGMQIYERFKRPEDRKRDQVLIGARNEEAMRLLGEALKSGQKRKIAIVYGIAHGLDLERRLKERGPDFRRVAKNWHAAWTIRDGKEPPQTPEKRL